MTGELVYALTWTARPERQPRTGEPDRAVTAELAQAIWNQLARDRRRPATGVS